MGVSNSTVDLSPQHIQDVLLEWFRGRHATSVQFVENTKPESEPNEDYTLAYEAAFEPSTLDRTRIEIWVATDGEIGIGIEKRDRIATRLGVKNRQKGFAAGHEPGPVTEQALLSLLTLVADGKVAITAGCLPIWGLTKTKAVVQSDAYKILISQGYGPQRWLDVTDEFQPSDLRFKPW